MRCLAAIGDMSTPKAAKVLLENSPCHCRIVKGSPSLLTQQKWGCLLWSKLGGNTAPLTRMGLPTSRCASSSLPMGVSPAHSVVPSPCLNLQAHGVRLGSELLLELQHHPLA